MELLRRAEATQLTLDRYLEVSFKWGSADCAHLACHHLDNCGVAHPLAQFRRYKTEIGAMRALHRYGVENMEALADALFDRIPPAFALPGDLVGIPGGSDPDAPWTALAVYLGNERVLAFADLGDGRGAHCNLGPLDVATHAWRVTF